MRKIVSTGLVIMLPLAGTPSSVLAASRQNGPRTAPLTGTVREADVKPLSGATVQARSIETGEVVSRTTSGQGGEFSFGPVPAGNYIVEVVDPSGRVVSTTPMFTVEAGLARTVSVVTIATGSVNGSKSGFSLFGLGQVTTMAVLGAAGAAAVTAVVATRPDASPSR